MKMSNFLKSNIKPEYLFSYLFLLVVTLFVSSSCAKHCRNIAVPDIDCDKHYDEAQAEILYEPSADTYFNYDDPPINFFITDSITYDSIFNNNRPLGNINFDEQFIIGIYRITNEGFEVHKKAKVCAYEKENKLKLKVKFSVYSQCAGSNISHKPMTVWAILPIKYVNYNIEYEVIDINPW